MSTTPIGYAGTSDPGPRRSLAKIALYAVPGVVAKSVHLVLLPVYVGHLGVAEFGALELWVTSLLLVQSGADLGWGQALLRFVHEADSPDRLVRALFVTRVGVFLAVGAGLGAVGFARSAAAVPDPVPVAALCAFGLFVLRDLLKVYELWMRAHERARAYALLQVSYAVLQLGCVAAALIWLRAGVVGVLAGQLVATVATLVWLLALGEPRVVRLAGLGSVTRAEWQLARRLLRFGAPLAPSMLAGALIFACDRYMLAVLVDDAPLYAVGAYGFAGRIAATLSVVVSGFTLYFSPYVFRVHREGDAPQKIARLGRLYLLALAAAALALCAVAPPLLERIAPAYVGALVVLPILLAALLVHYLGGDFAVGLELGHRTGVRAVASCAGIALNALSNLVLIPVLGIVGAAVSTLIGYVAMALVAVPVSQRVYRVPYPWAAWVASVVWLLGAGWISARSRACGGLHASIGLLVILLWAWWSADRGWRGRAAARSATSP